MKSLSPVWIWSKSKTDQNPKISPLFSSFRFRTCEMSATLLESILAGASKRSRINGIIDDLIATVVLGKAGEAGHDDENKEEVEEAETSKEEFSSFSLTSTTSGDLDKRRQGLGW